MKSSQKVVLRGKVEGGNGACYLRAQVLREAQKISRPLPLISGEVPRFHGGSLWHVSPVHARPPSNMDLLVTITYHHGFTQLKISSDAIETQVVDLR